MPLLRDAVDLLHAARVLAPVHLGAAPGGWSQLATKLVGRKGQVVALDILPMDPIDGVTVLLGDFREEGVLSALRETLGERPVDLVISDMAPNVSGVSAVDLPRTMYLCELALDFAREVLVPGGGMIIKVFQGEGFDDLLREMRATFKSVAVRKPKASRPESREVYLVARDRKL